MSDARRESREQPVLPEPPARPPQAGTARKRAYVSPTLTVWGTVQDLTRGNSGSQFDTDTSQFSGHA